MDEVYTEADRLRDLRREVDLVEDFRTWLVRTRQLARASQPPEGPLHAVVANYFGFDPANA